MEFISLPAATLIISTLMVSNSIADIPPFICNLDEYDCVCKPAERKIDCENKGIEHLMLSPDFKEYGYISLRNNYIKAIAPEVVVKEYYPQLKELDVRDNPDFHCSSLNGFSTIRIISDCPAAQSSTSGRTTESPTEPTTTAPLITSSRRPKIIVENCHSNATLYTAIASGSLVGIMCFFLSWLVLSELRHRSQRRRARGRTDYMFPEQNRR